MDVANRHALVGILLTNALTLIIAMWQSWSVLQLLWPFWLQSVIIGWYARQRILLLTRFCTKGVRINNRAVAPTVETQQKTALFFALHYGFFQLFYLIVLLVFTLTSDPNGFIEVTREGSREVVALYVGRVRPLDWWIFSGLALGFWKTHQLSHREHVQADLGNTPHIGTLMMMPYARIIPMHLCIVLAAPLGGGHVIWIFIILKTVADLLMHVVEHRVLQRRRGSEPASDRAGNF